MGSQKLVRTPISEVFATLEALQAQGVTYKDFEKIREYPENARRTAHFLSDGWVEGRRFILGLRDLKRIFPDANPTFSLETREVERNFPWPITLLEEPDPWFPEKMIRETHVAFFGPSKLRSRLFNIALLRKLTKGSFFGGLREPEDLLDRPFTKKTCGDRWYLMPTGPVPGTKELPYSEMVKLLPDEYEVPTSIERLLGGVLTYPVNGDLTLDLEGDEAFRRDKSSHYSHVAVGYNQGIGYRSWGLNDGNPFIGLAASRKLPE